MVDACDKVQKDSFMLFLGRTGGIIVGITLSLVFTILVLPSSAHNEVDSNLVDALHGLRRLNGFIWLPLSNTDLLAAPCNGSDAHRQSEGGEGRDVACQVQVRVGDCDKTSSEDVADNVRKLLREWQADGA